MIQSLAALAMSAAGVGHLVTLPPDLARAAHAYDKAQVEGDRRALESLIADDYLLINSRGQRETKAELIADYTAPGFSLLPFKVDQAVQITWPGGAILGGIAMLRGRDQGAAYSVRLRFTDVWVKRRGRWQVLYTHASRDPESSPRAGS